MNTILALLLGLCVGLAPVQSAARECGISERVVLENATDAPIMHTFKRGTHEGFVIVQPGQAVTVDLVWCE